MRKYVRFLACIMTIIATQTVLAQEKRNYKDIAFDYLLQNIESIDARPWRVIEDRYNKMPNGDYVVHLTISRTMTRQQEGWVNNQVQAYGATFNVGIKRGYIYTNYEDTDSYLIFINRYGDPMTFFKAPNKYEIKFWQDNVWILCNLYKEDINGQSYDVTGKIICRATNGNFLWEMSDMKIFDFANTTNLLYMSGQIGNGENKRSIVRTINMKTNKSVDKLGEYGDVAYKMSFREEGLEISEYKKNGRYSNYILPYAAEDRKFQVNMVLKKYDLKIASDQVKLGKRYLNGDILDKDEKKAFELFNKSAKQNNADGLNMLAYCYHKGFGVSQDYTQAVSNYEKSAKLGNVEAMVALSNMYAEGDGIAKDEKKALYWKEKLGFLGNTDAQRYVLAHNTIEYEHSAITAIEALRNARENFNKKNYGWARFCYERAIALGSQDASYELGKWLYEGNGIAKDYNLALNYLTKVGEEGNIEAQKLLVSIYEDNNGVLPDLEKNIYWTIYWTTKAAINGSPDMQVKLARAYLNGNGVAKNKKTAAFWYEKAAKQNNEDAIIKTVENYISGNGVKKNIETAMTYFLKLNSENQLNIANRAYDGINMKKNVKLAVIMYQELAKKQNVAAIKQLAFCYLEGNGVSKDIEKAYQLAKEFRRIITQCDDGDIFFYYNQCDDGDIYYIEGKYYEFIDKSSYYTSHRLTALDCYERGAIKGSAIAEKAYYKLRKKMGYRGESLLNPAQEKKKKVHFRIGIR